MPDNMIHGNIMHEMGHALGISGHSNHDEDIMKSGREWSSYEEYKNYKPLLSQRDILAVQRLYSPAWHRGEDLYRVVAANAPRPLVATKPPANKMTPSRANTYQGRILPTDYNPYLETVNHRINSFWHPPVEGLGDDVILKFKIDKAGNLMGYSLQKSSGDPQADRAAIAALKKASPFQPLPSGNRQFINVEMSFYQ
jgi:TonB family protein